MEITAKAKFIRTSPRKTRLVVDLVRGMKVKDALDQLRFVNKKVGHDIKKLVESGIANATHNYELDKDNLFIKEIRVDEGPTLKRWMPRAHGRATTIRKRTSHILLKISEVKDSGDVKAKKQEVEAPVKLDSVKKEEEDVNTVKNEKKDSKGSNKKDESKSSKGFAGKIFRRKSG